MNPRNERISCLQLNIVIILYTVGSSILFIPSLLANAAKQNGWISGIASIGLALFIITFIVKFHKVYPDKDLIQCFELALGKWLGKVLSLLFIMFTLILSALTLWSIGDFMVTMVMPDTPIHAIFILFIIVVIYGVRLGIESLVRSAEVFIPWVLGLSTIMILLLLPEIESTQLEPVLEGGFRQILAGMYYMIGFPFLELIIFLMITPHLNNKAGITKAIFTGTIVGGIILTLFTLFCTLVLGSEVTIRLNYPAYVLGKKISIGQFLERIEIIMAILWILSIYFKLAITFYVTCVGCAKVFSLKSYHSLTLPIGMLVITLTLIMIPDTVLLLEFNKASMPFKFTFLIILILVYIRLKLVKRKNNQASNQRNQAL